MPCAALASVRDLTPHGGLPTEIGRGVYRKKVGGVNPPRGVEKSLAPGMASAGARAYNGGLGALPPAGSRGRAPPETENLLASGRATEAANLPHSVRTLTLSK